MHYPCSTVQDLPQFDTLDVDSQLKAVLAAIAEARSTIDQMVKQQLTAGEFLRALEQLQLSIDNPFSPISHLHGVANTDDIREAYNSAIQALTDYGNWVGQHRGLYQCYEAIDTSTLNSADQEAVRQSLLSFKLSGIDLPEEQQQQLADINNQLSKLSTEFSNNVLDATDRWHHDVTGEDALAGMPPHAIAAAKEAAERADIQGYRLTLNMPSYLAVMMYADDAALRETLYTAYATRASDQGPDAGQSDNGPIINTIRALRHQKAQLLGYQNYAELSLAKKMADSTGQVTGFINDLAEQSLPIAKEEFAQLEEYAGRTLNPWDVAYYSEKLKDAQYSVNDEALKPYFSVESAIDGLFDVTSRLFGISIKQADAPVWHKDVRFYHIYDNDEIIAGFYFDLFAREQKRGGAWMADCRSRMMIGDKVQRPIAYLTCNFSAPTKTTPSLLSLNDVTTLFHEFGHGLHHMLTAQTSLDVSGINGVPWDAVELPSQFLENWCWQPDVIKAISSHYETGEQLPQHLLDAAIKAKNFQSAMAMVRQLEFGLFDFELHKDYNPDAPVSVDDTIQSVRERVAVVKPPKWHRFANGFSHIFAGGYAAGYYSYKWAEVLSADAFEAFEEEGIFNTETGKRFKNEILQAGGSRSAMQSFVAFRHREPKVDALLRHSGLVKEVANV